MRRVFAVVVAVAALVAVAACGSSNKSSSSTTAATTSATTTGVPSGKALGIATVPGVGTVLVSSSKLPLYSPQQEANGKILCTGECTTIWKPLTTTSGVPSGTNVAQLGVVTRPDGTKQVTFKGAPLYTFAQDSPGTSTGNGVTDMFNGKSFTWHVATVHVGSGTGTTTGTGATGTGGGGTKAPGY